MKLLGSRPNLAAIEVGSQTLRTQAERIGTELEGQERVAPLLVRSELKSWTGTTRASTSGSTLALAGPALALAPSSLSAAISRIASDVSYDATNSSLVTLPS